MWANVETIAFFCHSNCTGKIKHIEVKNFRNECEWSPLFYGCCEWKRKEKQERRKCNNVHLRLLILKWTSLTDSFFLFHHFHFSSRCKWMVQGSKEFSRFKMFISFVFLPFCCKTNIRWESTKATIIIPEIWINERWINVF